MDWITASLLMFISSVGLYLAIRKASLLKTPTQLSNLAMFLIPVVAYIFITFSKSTNFILSPFEYLIITIQGIFFSYLGNVFSLKGIEYAPNAGYSLIISKSYVVFTAIASIFLFSAPLTLKSSFAIALIIIFSALIIINKTKNKVHVNNLWLPYTIGAFFCWGMLALSTKYLLNLGVPILARLILSMIIVTAFIFGEIKMKKVSLIKISSIQLITLLVIGFFATGFNYFMQVGFDLAPNVGYVNAVNAASISLVTIFSILLFKDEFSFKKLLGVLGVTAGLIILLV